MADSSSPGPDAIAVDTEGFTNDLADALLDNIDFEAAPEAARQLVVTEFRDLFERIDSGVVALDYWFVKHAGLNTVETAEVRGVSHQAVANNVKKAEHELGELDELPDWINRETDVNERMP